MLSIDTYFQNKTAVISGAADGIGKALAVRLNAAGCHLWLGDIDAGKLEATVTSLDEKKANIDYQVVDCGNRQSIFDWASEVASKSSMVHALFNNAGVAYGAFFSESTEENYEWLLNINFWGVVHGTRAFLPLLLEAKRSHLVNLSSIFGMIGVPSQSAYNAAKFAVRGFSEALQAEYRQTKFHVSCVHPGGILTNIAKAARVDGKLDLKDVETRDREFRKLALTTPEKAAEVILLGTIKGKPRILVGWDAWLIYQIIKLMPTTYHFFTSKLANKL